MNRCQAGHTFHSRFSIKTDLGMMTVYDWKKYKDQSGIYCTGQDDVSRTLFNTGVWEPILSKLISWILYSGDRNNLVVDVGCNIGWYSRMAANLGYRDIVAYDGDKEHLSVLSDNVPSALATHMWFDNGTIPRHGFETIELLKCDIEGNEQYAVKYFENYFLNKRIKNLVMEVSPIFNASYPALIDKIVGYGYEAFEVNGDKFDFNFGFQQKDLWFKIK